jgi:hypothetical protein
MDAARECYHAMRELVLRHPGGRSSEASLAALRKLCHIADKAAADADCSARLAAIEEHAALLFSGCGSGNWVRRRLLAELEQFRSRLYVLEVENSSKRKQAMEKAA